MINHRSQSKYYNHRMCEAVINLRDAILPNHKWLLLNHSVSLNVKDKGNSKKLHLITRWMHFLLRQKVSQEEGWNERNKRPIHFPSPWQQTNKSSQVQSCNNSNILNN